MAEADTVDPATQLRRLLSFVDGGFNLGEHKQAAKIQVAPETQRPQRQHSFFVESWPEAEVKPDVILTARRRSSRMKPAIGGAPITQDTATKVRKTVYGSTVHSFSSEWKKAGFNFQCENSPFPYGLVATRNGTRGLLMCVQGEVLKHLIFRYEGGFEEILRRNVLKPSDWQRKQALVVAIVTMLWRAGNKQQCCICLPQESECYVPSQQLKKDGITEKLHLFDFKSYDEVLSFVKRHLSYFEEPGGCILLLYSVTLSRTIDQLHTDYGQPGQPALQLLTDMEECSVPLLNLLLTGRAVRYLHNGDLLFTSEGLLLAKPQQGLKERSDVGFLFWHKDEDKDERTQVGSMLKTPKKPIWVTQVNGQFGILFSLNPNLVSDWRVEHKFTLNYYTGIPTHIQHTRLTVDTRFGKQPRGRTMAARQEERRIPAMECCITTKWYGADINWNGQMPFV